jgi:hypothetical protein
MKPFDADEEPDRRPVLHPRQKRIRCAQRGCRRDLEPDSVHWSGEFVHIDTGLYQCDPSDKRFRMATAR